MKNQTIVKFLSQLRQLNIQLSSEGEKLRCQAPEGVLTPALSRQIAERKAEILAFLQQVRQKTHKNLPAISVIPRDKNLPLSFAQERLWFLNQLEGSSVAYNSPGALRITGNLNLNSLQLALSEIVCRHEVLRTSFQTVNGTPIQVIDPEATLNLKIVDLQQLEITDRETVLQQQLQQEIITPFNLEIAPLIRCSLWQLDGTEYVFSLTMHHIISDAWSIGIFIQELSTLYQAFTQGEPSPLAELPIQYADFAVWQREYLSGEVLETQLNYWQKQLNGAPELLQLPTDRPRPAVQTYRGAQHSVILSKSIVTSLNALAQSQGVTLFAILVTALKILLLKWTGQSDIVLGTVIAGRNRSEIEPLIGCFINFLALRNHLNGQQRADELLQQVGKKVVEAYSNQDCPFQKIIEALNPNRQLSHNPIYNVALLLQNFPLKEFFNDNIEATSIDLDLESSVLDLRFVIFESSEKMLLDCEYNTDLFERDTIKQLVDAYQATLEKLVEQPVAKLSDFELSEELEVKAKAAKAREQKQKIAIAATFTAEPVEDYLDFWMKELDMSSVIEFAPYNQVFQELLNPVSLLATNQDGVNVVLVRFEDWHRKQSSLQLNVDCAEKERILANQSCHTLPNRLEIASLNQYETEYLYREIFVDRAYLKHGIVLNEDDCVVDVGANIGLFTLFLQQKCPNGTIYAFEPAPHAFKKLQSNVRLYCKNVNLFNCGLGAENKEKKFTFYPRSSVFSSFAADTKQDEQAIRAVIVNILQRDNSLDNEAVKALAQEFLPDRLEQETYNAQLLTLSRVIDEHNIESIDLLKLDAEKSELAILQGIEDRHWSRIKQIVVEVHDQNGSAFRDVKVLLQEKGFKLVVDEETLLEGSGLYNIYATRPASAQKLKLEQPDQKVEKIEQNVRDLASALKTVARSSSTPYLVCVCPASTTAIVESDHIALYRRMEDFLASYLKELSNIYLVKTSELVSIYPVSDYYDPHGDELGHIPYTPTFFSALGTMLARKIHALKTVPYKVIVLDCDQTLWKGVCGEDGAAGVEIDTPHQALQEFIVAQQKAGKLICLCSKNEETDVWAVFQHHYSMPLKRENLVSWRINWKSKSENLKDLAQELQVGLDSFIFIDDNPIECAEVQANCPEVLTVQLPSDSSRISEFLKHIWAFDRLKVTAEDKARTEHYRQNVEREKMRQESLTFEEFLQGLGLKVEISALKLHQLTRVAQLTQRTNQFNLTTIRRSEGEVQEFCESGKQECLVVEVKDRFGDYGLVGALMFESGADALIVDSFLLSCRVLGRGVEHQMLAKLGAIASERGLIYVDVPYIPTQKNKPAFDFLESVDREGKDKKGQGWLFKFKVDVIEKLTLSPEKSKGIAAKKLPTQKEVSTAVQYQSKSGLYERIATELCQAVQVLKVIEEHKQKKRPELKEVFVAPRNPVEEMVAGMWKDVLKLEQVGINDNFFELGGHSLLATQLISKLRKAFDLEIPLRTVFESPTVTQLDQTLTQLRTNDSGLSLPPIQARTEREQLPLSWAQERLWFLNQLEGSSATYNMPGAVRITGNLKLNALQQALSEIVRRHEVLRTCFPTVNGTPIQVIDPEANLNIKVVDLQQLEVTERENVLQQQVQQEATTPFNLEIAPLIRCSLWQLNATEYVFLLTMHHIVSDGWSIGIFIQELSTLYQAFTQGEPSPLAELPIQYADFAVWQREYLSGEVLETQLNYWQKQLNGAPELLQLPTDRPRPAVQTYRGATQTFTLSTDLTQKLQTLSGNSGTTLFMTLEAAFATLLYRYSGQSDILIGSPIANRNRSEIESLIGCFVNTLVLRTSLKDNPSFESLLTQVRETTLKAYEHQDVPFEQVVEALQPQRSLSHSPLFQVLFVLQNTPIGEVEIPGVTLSQLDRENNIAKFDLTLSITETDQGLVESWEYNTDLFDESTIKRMAGHFQNLLSAIVENPQLSVAEFSLLSEAEQHQLLLEWNDTATKYSSNKCIHQLFESQVEKNPDAVAMMFENQQLTYQQLNQRANQLAHHLQSLGVRPEVLVGICVQRSVEMLVGLLGILKAGGAYVPLDPNYPLERLSYILADSGVEVLLTQQSLLESLPKNQARVVCLDANGGAIERNSQDNLDLGVCSDNLAYAIYTSGSTGKPKGVQIQHKALVNFLESMQQKPGLESNDILLSVTTLSFDIAGLELYLPLITGARLVLVSQEITADGILLAQSIEDYQITTMQATPATWRLLLTAGWKGNKQLKILCGGEALDMSLAEELLKISQQVWNLYGPTEATIWSIVAQVDNNLNASSVPIGRAINNTQIYILDKHLQPLPIGVPGELYIGGDGLAQGYLNRPELTSEKFIPNPFSDSQSERLYKTGDLARYGGDGNIEFIGRIDNQVKVRGFRIELGEIESILNTYPQIQQALVIPTEDIPENKRLVAYVVTSDESLKTNQLREFLKQKLPEYMVPSAFVILDTLPLTPNGKLDHKALPAPDTAQLQENFVPPRDLVELQLTQIWSNILNIRSLGVRDNFFDLGGNSLFAIRLMTQIEQQFGRNLPLATLFQGQTVEQLATILRKQSDSNFWSSLVPIQTGGHKQPFFCVAGGGGNVLYFYHLARHLGSDQPLYALQSVGLDGGSEPYTRIEDIAAHYIEAIKSVQPRGPYLLGGHSFGALVAFETAQQLQKQGNEVAQLAILDMHAPDMDKRDSSTHQLNLDWDSARMLTSIAGVFERMFGKNIGVSYESLKMLPPEEQLNYVNERFQMVNLFPPETGIKQIRGLLQVARANQNSHYVPQDVYPTQITLFRANEEVPMEIAPSENIHRLLYDSRRSDPMWGWGEFSAGEVELHTVPGDHLTMMAEPHVRVLAEKLKASLEKAQAANPMPRP